MIETKFPIVKNEVFESHSYIRVIDDINANIRSNTSIIVLTGEPGTGKTLIAHKVLKNLGKNGYTVFFEDPRFTVDEMISSACGQIGVTSVNLQNKLEIEKKLQIFLEYLEERSQEKGPVRLFIDEAQNVNTGTLSSILKLMKWRSSVNRALQVILIGLPQLKTLLASPELSELKNVNRVYLRLKPLGAEEVEAFATQRLNAFNIERDDFFSFEAIARIVSYTRGIPSLVGILIDSVMAIMNPNEHSVITEELVDEAVDFFSIPWAAGIKNSHEIQSTGDKKKMDFEKSMQVSSSTEDNKIDRETLVSKVKEKVTNLFSRKKITSTGFARDHQIAENNVEEEKPCEVLAEELKRHGHGENGGKVEYKDESFDALMKAQGHQNANKKAETIPRISLQQNKQVNSMNVREETMNRGELLNEELKALQSGSPDVEAVALISEDGLVVASALPQDLDEIRVGGMSATILSLGTRSSAELRRGKVEEIVVRGEKGYTVMLNAGQGTLLLVVANQNAKLGLIFFDMREAIEKIAGIL